MCLQLIIEILNYAWGATVVVVVVVFAVVVCAKQMLISSQYLLKTKLSKFVFVSQQQSRAERQQKLQLITSCSASRQSRRRPH